MSRLSVIIPTLNERRLVRSTLRRLRELRGIAEIIVVDGGSDDGTPDLARRVEGVRVLSSARGRARQMNAGAAVATGDVLLFLHADVRLPHHAARLVDEALEDPAAVAGAFKILTVNDGAPSWVDRGLWIADLRSHYTRAPYGDQAIFVRRGVFEALGGFPNLALMEDLALSRALRRVGRIVTVPGYVVVSGRRFVARPFLMMFLVNVYPMLFHMGVPPSALARFYLLIR